MIRLVGVRGHARSRGLIVFSLVGKHSGRPTRRRLGCVAGRISRARHKSRSSMSSCTALRSCITLTSDAEALACRSRVGNLRARDVRYRHDAQQRRSDDGHIAFKPSCTARVRSALPHGAKKDRHTSRLPRCAYFAHPHVTCHHPPRLYQCRANRLASLCDHMCGVNQSGSRIVLTLFRASRVWREHRRAARKRRTGGGKMSGVDVRSRYRWDTRVETLSASDERRVKGR
jgi:hypothetical protein